MIYNVYCMTVMAVRARSRKPQLHRAQLQISLFRSRSGHSFPRMKKPFLGLAPHGNMFKLSTIQRS